MTESSIVALLAKSTAMLVKAAASSLGLLIIILIGNCVALRRDLMTNPGPTAKRVLVNVAFAGLSCWMGVAQLVNFNLILPEDVDPARIALAVIGWATADYMTTAIRLWFKRRSLMDAGELAGAAAADIRGAIDTAKGDSK